MNFWQRITQFGDTSLLLPAAILISVWLVAANHRKLAALWTFLYASAMGVVSATKIAFMGWGIGIPAMNFTGISGHTAFATTVFPVLFRLAASKRSCLAQRTAVCSGFLLSYLIGVSRLFVNAHSLSEVIAGCLLGSALSYFFLSKLVKAGEITIHWPLQFISAISLCGFLLMSPAPTQRLLKEIAAYLAGQPLSYIRMPPSIGFAAKTAHS
jgi:membrane-associated phospholipid phosphatase